MNEFNILFLGCFYPHYCLEDILTNTKGKCQFAADKLQWALIDGFIQNEVNLELLSFPVISTYPVGYKKIYFRGGNFVYKDVKGYCASFLNLPFVNFFCDDLSAKIKKWYFSTSGKKCLFVYSLQVNLMRVALKMKKKFPDLHLCIIIPDLPEYMGCSKFYKFIGARKIEIDFIYNNINKFDSFVLLSKHMVDKLNIQHSRYTVVEGIFSGEIKLPINKLEQKEKVILYTGNINRKYGIKELVDAFMQIPGLEYRLWIRGDGELMKYVIEKSRVDMRIKYLAKVTQDELVLLQQKATLLINPISNKEEITKYFFPSKTMDYLASGTPTLMYRLECLPQEYADYLYFIPNGGIDAIKEAIIKVCEKSPIELEILAKSAADFIMKYKNPRLQVLKILNVINSN